ncbi:hypothetical protein FIBSPDRAFT_901759 [Athelia psychrophila]|uniref:Uncharacterized protein n=1 Tax=Athelia psychrophila TaxID=1759441 RepID=A0A165WQR3_9AGAM|nr:hypothetical protein FIBSPDRAFT_901759 [Fibularhizoctonia sp. CBS 109695]
MATSFFSYALWIATTVHGSPRVCGACFNIINQRSSIGMAGLLRIGVPGSDEQRWPERRQKINNTDRARIVIIDSLEFLVRAFQEGASDLGYGTGLSFSLKLPPTILTTKILTSRDRTTAFEKRDMTCRDRAAAFGKRDLVVIGQLPSEKET